MLAERSKTPKTPETKLGPKKTVLKTLKGIFSGSACTRYVQPVALKAVSPLEQVQQAERERQMQLEEAAAAVNWQETFG